MKTIHVQYFASLREQRGLARETVTTLAASVAALYEELKARHGFALGCIHVRAAINDEFIAWDTPLHDGEKIVFLPPMAGG